MDNYNYPIGADTKGAPWNQEGLPEKEVEVAISITLSKTVKVKINDYVIIDSGKDEDGDYFESIDYSNCDLKKAVEEQITLPQDAWKGLRSILEYRDRVLNDLKDWNVDDFEVILE